MKQYSLKNLQTIFAMIAGLLYMTIKYCFEPEPMIGWMLFLSLFISAFVLAKLIAKKYQA